VESNHPNHGCAISQSYSDGGGGVGGAVGIGEPVAVEVATRLPEVGVGVRWLPDVEVALGRGVSIAVPVAVLVFDSVGDALGVADLTGGIVELGVLAFVAAGAGVEVAEGAEVPKWLLRPLPWWS